jgi:hypothetical protein
MLEEHHAEAREAEVVLGFEGVTLHIGGHEGDVIDACRRGPSSGILEKLLDAVQAQHLAPRTGLAGQHNGGIAPAAAHVQDPGSWRHREPLEGHPAVVAQAVHQDFLEPGELLGQGVVPELDVFVDRWCRGLSHGTPPRGRHGCCGTSVPP